MFWIHQQKRLGPTWAALCSLVFFLSAPFSAAVLDGAEWEVLENVGLVEHRNNDADSFRVRWGEKEFTVRIYFVDACEAKPYLRDRVAEQAAYFGITPEQSVDVGQRASEFVLTKLRQDGFTITTRWQNYPDRVYAIITTGGRDLGELLINNGLGRNHGQTIAGLTKPVRKKLSDIEAEARAARRGAWALTQQAGP